LALEAVSRKLTSVTTSTGITRAEKLDQGRAPGQYGAGRPDGRVPTTAPPASAYPRAQLSAPAAPTTTMAAGKLGRQRRASISSARLPSPKAAAVRSNRPGEGVVSRVLHSAALRPVSAPSCEPRISSAAACVKPLSTGEVTRLSSQPKRASPITSCSSPESMAIHAAMATHWALPGSARPVSDAPISRLVSAVGPTPSRVEALNNTAISAGISEA